jgi:5-(carboxyamino)imidazole ribonucleotide synthase
MIVGVLGAGQLGRMLALAGYPLGLRFRFLDPTPDSPAGQLAEQVVGRYDDQAALDRFAAGLTAVTYEFENVPVAAAHYLAERVPVFPPPAALEVAQDRLAEKTFFARLGIPTPPFAPVDSRRDLQDACARLGLPAVLKTRRGGYDGKGQWVIRTPEEVATAWQAAGGQPLILESFVPFTRELSILAVRGGAGATACYPLVENTHRDGILRRSLAPAPGVTPALQARAEGYATQVLDALGYAGVLAIELFQVDDQLLANEMAPRVHNSGHWTIEGAVTSQFANHLRAGLGWPLGATEARGVSAMLNLIGTLPDPAAVLAVPGAALHLYGKQPRPGRKLGHITLWADDTAQLAPRLEQVEALL